MQIEIYWKALTMKLTRLLPYFICVMCGLNSQITFADALMTKKSAQGVQYITGGISEEEVIALKPYIKKYNLRLIFSEGTSGRSATPVNVNIYDLDSKLVFRVSGAQPQLLVDLPAGTYTVLASYNGEKLRHKFELGTDEFKKIILNWRNLVDEDMPMDGEGN
jgi:hypothetical protein